MRDPRRGGHRGGSPRRPARCRGRVCAASAADQACLRAERRERAEARDGSVPTVVLVGKGITFDSGGLTLKSFENMLTMKTDMSGAADVIATLGACRALAVRVKVVAIAPTTENMPGGRAVKPGDVLEIRNGKTIEVLNTDCEGRLVLADGLSLAVEEQPDAIIDLATLTGACVVALPCRRAPLLRGPARAPTPQRLWPAHRAVLVPPPPLIRRYGSRRLRGPRPTPVRPRSAARLLVGTGTPRFAFQVLRPPKGLVGRLPPDAKPARRRTGPLTVVFDHVGGREPEQPRGDAEQPRVVKTVVLKRLEPVTEPLAYDPLVGPICSAEATTIGVTKATLSRIMRKGRPVNRTPETCRRTRDSHWQ